MSGSRRFWWKALSNRRILCGLLLVLAVAAGYQLRARRDMSDFGVCYQAGGRILPGETLYRETDEHLQFKYAPAAALFYAPFSALPWEAAKVLWFLVMLACLAVILRVLSRWASGRGRKSLWPLVWTVAVMAKCLGREFELGQVNILILLLFVLMLRETMAGKEARAGLFLGLSLLFKPYGLIFIPYLILKKKGKALAFGAAAILAGLLIPVINYGWAGNLTVLGEWVRTLSASTPGLLLVGDNASLYAFVAKTFRVSESGAMIGGGFIAAALGVLLLLMIRLGKRGQIAGAEFAEVAGLMILIPMVSPLGWNYNYLYGLPAVFILLLVLDRFSGGEKAALIVNFVLIGGTLVEVLGKTAFRFYTGHSLVVPSFVMIFGLLFIARRRQFI